MQKKLFKRFIPSLTTIKENPRLQILGPLLEDPNLFHFNRHSVSMAFLTGIFFAFVPIPAQMLFAGFFALWFRCNLPITIALVWITNPITVAPIYFATYKLGSWLLNTPPIRFDGPISWQWINSELGNIWKPLLTGSLCAGSFFSITSYFLVSNCWRFYTIYQWRKRQRKNVKINLD